MITAMSERRLRRATALAAVLGATLMLSGCFSVTMDLYVRSDDTVDGTAVLAVDRSLVDAAGGEHRLIDSLTRSGSSFFGAAPSAGTVHVGRYESNGSVGVQFEIKGVPLTDFGSGSDVGSAGGLSISRVGDTYVVSGTFDPSLGVAEASAAQAMASDSDITLAISFPGEVLHSNGTVTGQTVTWKPDAGHQFRLQAVAKANSPGTLPMAKPLAWVGVGALVLVVVLAGVVVARRRSAW